MEDWALYISGATSLGEVKLSIQNLKSAVQKLSGKPVFSVFCY